MTVSRDGIAAVLGPVDEALAAAIAATGASVEELAAAWAWINSDEALLGEGRPPPSGRVAELIGILSADEEEDERH